MDLASVGAAVLAACGAGFASPGAPVVALFLAGLAGSAAHCAPMCGPIVLAQAADRLAAVPASRLGPTSRLASALLLPYHAGRLTIYGGLGALAGAGGAGLAALPWLGRASGLLLLAAALAFLGRAVVGWRPGRGCAGIGAVGRLLQRAGGRRCGGYGLGLALGFLPCGLVYAALAVAAAGAGPLLGAATMLAFGAGTVPALVAIATLGQFGTVRWRPALARAAPYLMLFNAMLLGSLAWRALAA